MDARRLLAPWILVLGALLPAGAVSAAAGPLEEAQALMDSGQPAAAVEILDDFLEEQKKNAEGYLLRSTAYFILGDDERGRKDLQRALELDPELRQAWLNKAALALADENYSAALEAFLEAKELDPSADDNFLNLGVVRLLMGQLDRASENFQRYLERNPTGSAHYLVATNYAMAGYPGLAVRFLDQAIQRDERIRVRVRSDPNFRPLQDNPRFQELLLEDSYRPPPGSHRAERVYSLSYRRGEGPLLQAVLDALHALRMTYDPRIEVTPDWSLIWSDMRIKVTGTPEGDGKVVLTAPPEQLTPREFEKRSDELLDRILIEVGKRVVRPSDR
ncbi:MAG: tetratricopeptide repeat protein [Thermoanaerobaculia bacterium]|nr:tetratricopeptide repeat protein [Thermoanaerobaculia bacterium]